MQKYELLYIIPAQHTEDELKKLTVKIGEIVKKTGAEPAEAVILGKRKLAYPINHVRYGYYVMVDLEAEKDVMKNLDRTLRLTTDVLRHLVILKDPSLTKIPEFAESGEIVREKKEERGGRDTRRAPRKAAPIKKKAAEDVDMKDLDKKLDEILTEEVL